jgi:hypothetical protein
VSPERIARAVEILGREIRWCTRQADRVAAIPPADDTDRADIARRAAAVSFDRSVLLDVLALVDPSAAERVNAENPESRAQTAATPPKIDSPAFAGPSPRDLR